MRAFYKTLFMIFTGNLQVDSKQTVNVNYIWIAGESKMSSVWATQGATLSLKNACKEFGLTENEIIKAMKSGKLQYRQNYVHGNPYFKVVRDEVKSLAEILHGSNALEEHKESLKLKKLNREIANLKRKISSLEKQKFALQNK